MFLQWWFVAQPPSLIPAYILGYTDIYYIASFVIYFGHGYFWHLPEGGCPHEVLDGLPLKGEPAGLVWHQTITLSTPVKNK